MRILLVNDYGTAAGGAETGLVTLRDALRRRGHQVRLFASNARSGRDEYVADDLCLGTTSRFRTVLQTANPWAYYRMRQVLEAFRPEVVHVRLFLTQLSPLILPLLRHVPSLYEAVWYRPICLTGTKLLPNHTACHDPWGRACLDHGCVPARDWFWLMLQMRLWQRWRGCFRAIVATSEAVSRQLGQAGFEPPPVVPPGVPARPPRPPLQGPPLAVFAGRLVQEKGLDVLLRAFALVVGSLPGARLVAAGAGPEQRGLQQLADELGLADRVTFSGHLPAAELEQLCEAAWVQVVPSVWAEPLGMVAVEAMMRGTAVVASAAGGLAEVVRDGQTGFLVPPGDAAALAQGLLRVLQSRELAERLGHAGRAAARLPFSADGFAERLLALYASLLIPGGEPVAHAA